MQKTRRKQQSENKVQKKQSWTEEKEGPDTDGSAYLDFKVVVEGSRKKNSKEESYGKIQFLPTVELRVEDMKKDPLELLVQLEKVYGDYGAVKLQTPQEWAPQFSFKYSQKLISTRIQPLHYLKEGKPFKQKEESYDIRGFMGFAKDYDRRYKFKTKPKGPSKEVKHQEEYWTIVKSDPYSQKGAALKTRVEYAADLPSGKFGSGFPIHDGPKAKDQHFDYAKNWFNLNRICQCPSSLSKFTSKRGESISGITQPWVYMGMKFSTFCWHVEDLGLNSINYSHQGGIKTWYVVPQKYKEKFDAYVESKTGQPSLLNKITYMLDPLELIDNGIPVYKAYQKPGQYICTFFNAYHGGFSQEFNIGEAVNVISLKSLEVIKNQIQHSKKPEVLSYQWLIYENYLQEDIQSKLKATLKPYYKEMVNKEYDTLAELAKIYKIKIGREMAPQEKYFKNICGKCRNYQYLSSLRCDKCKKNYCLKDVQKCCEGEFSLEYRALVKERHKILALLS